jgi:hypothetical protein
VARSVRAPHNPQPGPARDTRESPHTQSCARVRERVAVPARHNYELHIAPLPQWRTKSQEPNLAKRRKHGQSNRHPFWHELWETTTCSTQQATAQYTACAARYRTSRSGYCIRSQGLTPSRGKHDHPCTILTPPRAIQRGRTHHVSTWHVHKKQHLTTARWRADPAWPDSKIRVGSASANARNERASRSAKPVVKCTQEKEQ